MAEQTTWLDKLAAERKRLGKQFLTREELLALARTHTMTKEEIDAQRASWTRQNMD